MHSIPVVDMKQATDPGTRAAFVQDLGRALTETGFVAVLNHGIDLRLIDQGYATARDLFALPFATKRAHETPEDGRQRGYTSFGVEHAKDVGVPDLKEFWHVGRRLPSNHPLRVSGAVPRNRFPSELPEARIVFQQLFDELEGFANRLLDAFGAYLELPDGYFRELVADGNSVQRLIHYPELGDDTLGGMVRAAAHEDINLITVLPWSPNPGLQILTREGTWLDVTTPKDVMICDTGDMMQFLSAGTVPATTHRVVNPLDRDEARYSMPFFLHPSPHNKLVPFRPGGGEPVLAAEFLRQRLEEIGVA
jgi:isopenicillin N synthase-like dioxygenase